MSPPDDDNAIMSCHDNINTIASGGRNFCAQLAGDGKTVWLGPLSTASGAYLVYRCGPYIIYRPLLGGGGSDSRVFCLCCHQHYHLQSPMDIMILGTEKYTRFI